ncbi:MAG: CDP-alcohol phosphatidyltransferase [Firmicutes bacterium HGW-Firmicutes-16]|nr:MAG: CDP-alcohol phosphatidyltransferase [Firmicutes bacterium HGW-Firmicutes-16]
MKYAANLITLARIVLAVVLLLLPPLGLAFILVYLICGLSDVLDGYIARKTKTESALGSRMDSVADFIFMMSVLIVIYPIIKPSLGILLWISGIALIRFVAVGVVWVKFGTPAMLHTLANKATGILFFLLPLSLALVSPTVPVLVLCIAATLSAVEELAIDILSASFQPDIGSIFSRNQAIIN